MRDSVLVREFERVNDLARIRLDRIDAHRTLREQIRQSIAFDKLHDDGMGDARFDEAVNRGYAGVV